MTGAGEIGAVARSVAKQRVLDSLAAHVEAGRAACAADSEAAAGDDTFTAIGMQRSVLEHLYQCNAGVLQRAAQIAGTSVARADTDEGGVTEEELKAAIAEAHRAYSVSSETATHYDVNYLNQWGPCPRGYSNIMKDEGNCADY